MLTDRGEVRTLYAVIITAIVVGVVVGAGTYFATRPAPGKERLRIGIIVPKTGIYSALGPRVLDGERMAIKDQGKILGKIPLVFERDSHTKKTKAVTAAKELIKGKNVDMIFGAINTPINSAIATVCDKNEVPFLYPSGGSVFMSGVKDNPHPYMFFSWGHAKNRALGAVRAAREYGTKFYFIASDYKYGHNSVDYAKKALKAEFGADFEVVGESWLPQGAKDYTGAIANAKKANPDVVFMCLPGVFTPAVKQAAKLGLKDIAHIHWAYGSRPTGLAAGKYATGVTSVTTSPLDSSPMENFKERFYEKYGYYPGWPEHAAYNGATMFLRGVAKAGTAEGPEIVKALEGLELPGSIAGEPTYFRAANHHIVCPWYYVKWTSSEKYKGGYWKTIEKIPTEEIEGTLLPENMICNYPEMRKG